MLTVSSSDRFYQVGGSLPFNASTYVSRQADEVLFQGLRRGNFCYVFNARQMGKSSLRVRVTHRLQAIGVRCGVVDITTIGSRDVNSDGTQRQILQGHEATVQTIAFSPDSRILVSASTDGSSNCGTQQEPSSKQFRHTTQEYGD